MLAKTKISRSFPRISAPTHFNDELRFHEREVNYVAESVDEHGLIDLRYIDISYGCYIFSDEEVSHILASKCKDVIVCKISDATL